MYLTAKKCPKNKETGEKGLNNGVNFEIHSEFLKLKLDKNMYSHPLRIQRCQFPEFCQRTSRLLY